jgi:alanyl-tRNA synthetase
MKTAIAYYDHVTADPFAATILEIRKAGERTALILDRTLFYPEGGGQPGDRGTINGAALLDVQETDGEILHLVAAHDGTNLKTGPAELRLDAARRRDFTVHHTAQHLLSGTILRLTGKPTVSMRLGDEVCTIDVDTPELTAETLVTVEEAVQDAIEADAPVIIHHCPPERVEDFPLRKTPPKGEEVIRVVEIQGNDFSPCCGTHTRSTGQIGILRILGAEKYKGMTRVSFIAGRRVLRDSRLLRQNGETISRALKIPVAETGNATLALLDRMNLMEKQLKDLAEKAALVKAETLLREAGLLDPASKNGVPDKPEPEGKGLTGDGRVLSRGFVDVDIEDVLRIGRAAQKLTGAALVLGSQPDLKFAVFCSVKGRDIRPLVKDAMEVQGGRGGGGPSFFQGVFSSAEGLEAFLQGLPKDW